MRPKFPKPMNPILLIIVSILVLVIPIALIVWMSLRISNSLEIIALDENWVRCEIQATYVAKQARYGEDVHILFYDQAGEIAHRLDLERWGIGRIEGLKRQLSLDGWQIIGDETQQVESSEKWRWAYQRSESAP